MELTKEDVKLIEEKSFSCKYQLYKKKSSDGKDTDYYIHCNCVDSASCGNSCQLTASSTLCKKHRPYKIFNADLKEKRKMGETYLVKEDENKADSFRLICLSTDGQVVEDENDPENYDVEMHHKVTGYVDFSPSDGVKAYKSLKRKDKEEKAIVTLKHTIKYYTSVSYFVFDKSRDIYDFINKNKAIRNSKVFNLMRTHAGYGYSLEIVFTRYLVLLNICPRIEELAESGLDDLVLHIAGDIFNSDTNAKKEENILNITRVFNDKDLPMSVFQNLHNCRAPLSFYYIYYDMYKSGVSDYVLNKFLKTPEYFVFCSNVVMRDLSALTSYGYDLIPLADYLIWHSKKDTSDSNKLSKIMKNTKKMLEYVLKCSELELSYDRFPDLNHLKYGGK